MGFDGMTNHYVEVDLMLMKWVTNDGGYIYIYIHIYIYI